MDQAQTIDATPLHDDPLPPSQWIGRWPGVVVSTQDPLRLGRVRVRVPQVYGDTPEDDFIPDGDLPWAIPSFPTHDYHADFEVGDGVWVEFWGGNPNFPIWCGQFVGDGDAPSEFTSSYSPTPKTRILRTTNGHTIEMRWVAGQEKIRLKTAAGSFIEMLDSPVEGGIKIVAETPGGRRMELSDFAAASRVAIETPTQKVEVVDTPTPAVNVTGTAVVTVQGGSVVLTSTGGPPVTHTFTGPLVYSILSSLTYTIALALTMTITGLATITGGTGLLLLTLAGVVSLGMAGAKFKLVDSRFFAFYDAHTHPVTTAPGVTGVPTVPSTPSAAVLGTTTTEAN
jgi:hypothetical protein